MYDYPLFDGSRKSGDPIVGTGEPNARGEIVRRTPEEEAKFAEALQKIVARGQTVEDRQHGRKRPFFAEEIVMFDAKVLPEPDPFNPVIARTKSLAFAVEDAGNGRVAFLNEKGWLFTFPYTFGNENGQWPPHKNEIEKLGPFPDAERVFLSADRHIGLSMASKLLVYTRGQDDWTNTATEEAFAATACIWDWDTDEFLLVDKDGEKFYRLGGTDADKPKPAGRIDDAARQQALKDAWATTKLPATRPE